MCSNLWFCESLRVHQWSKTRRCPVQKFFEGNKGLTGSTIHDSFVPLIHIITSDLFRCFNHEFNRDIKPPVHIVNHSHIDWPSVSRWSQKKLGLSEVAPDIQKNHPVAIQMTMASLLVSRLSSAGVPGAPGAALKFAPPPLPPLPPPAEAQSSDMSQTCLSRVSERGIYPSTVIWGYHGNNMVRIWGYKWLNGYDEIVD